MIMIKINNNNNISNNNYEIKYDLLKYTMVSTLSAPAKANKHPSHMFRKIRIWTGFYITINHQED